MTEKKTTNQQVKNTGPFTVGRLSGFGKEKTADNRPYQISSPERSKLTFDCKQRSSMRGSPGVSTGFNTPLATSRHGSIVSRGSDRERKSFQIK